jgi:hypothetical protein
MAESWTRRGALPSSETNSCSATHEIPIILYNLKFHYGVHRNLPLIHIFARWIQSINPNILYPTHFNIILHLRLGIHIGHIISGFPIKTSYAFLSQACYTACPSHPPCFEHSNIWQGVQLMKPLIKLQPSVTSSLFDPNFPVSTLFSNTLSLCSSLNNRYHVSHPRKIIKF